jgi:aerobic-type carbon monoxide dehydrogenase small subunit (CoxS/CutS family)
MRILHRPHDGVAMRSCGMPVSEAVGKITTIGDYAANGALHKVQQARSPATCRNAAVARPE